MADDDMLLNFDFGTARLPPPVKFIGGKWRDRVRAQNSVKKWQKKETPASLENAPSREKPNGSEKRDDEASRPTKRQRVESSANEVRSVRCGHVASRLFTSNPAPQTKIDESAQDASEPAKPSNAPLTEEAANFHALGLSKRVAQHLASKLDLKAPTAIQKNTIPQLVQGDGDAFLQAETGSGKTLAYLLPVVQRIMALSLPEDGVSKPAKIHRNSGLFAIVLAPTRELCKQISVVVEKLLRCAPWLVSTTVMGGESKKSEKARLRKGVNMLIATPGRLADHLENTKVLDLGMVRWLVLDEGDRMMEMGFEDDLRRIVASMRKDELQKLNGDGCLPSRRVTILCSATMKMTVQRLGEISLEDATHITAHASAADEATPTAASEAVFSAPSQLKQSYIIAPAKLRLVTLISLLKASFARRGSIMKAIVFVSCADSVDFHFDLLKSPEPADASSATSKSAHGHSTVAPASYMTSPASKTIVLHRLHGSLPQPVRTSTLRSFMDCKDPCLLITTDMASRGLDVPSVDLVVEYDPAFAVPDHVHRIGRTARAGRPGKTVLFLMPGCEEGYMHLLKNSSPTILQLSETVLQAGLASAVHLPVTTWHDASEPQTRGRWKQRAEALQLHLEQRLLEPPGPAPEDATESPDPEKQVRTGKCQARHAPKRRDKPLLEAARTAFCSHIRAYATHIREERHVFDMTQLHLGHVAKSFGLREAPGGIGSGASRRRHHHGKGGQAGTTEANVAKKGRGADSADEGAGAVDDQAKRRMRQKIKTVMSASSEFNLG